MAVHSTQCRGQQGQLHPPPPPTADYDCNGYDCYAVRNKNFMQTIFEVSIQPATGYLVNCHLSIPIHIKFLKLYCSHMKQKFCHLLFTLGNVNY